VGRTALNVTELGFGSATIAGMNGTVVTPEQAQATVTAALEAGIGYVDTAPHYGSGRAEHFVGDALRFRPEPYVLSTKVGRLLEPVRSEAERKARGPLTQPFPFEPRFDYSYDAIMRSFEASLQRLGLGKIDILLVHDIGAQTHGKELNDSFMAQLNGGGYRALDELRSQGVISAIGLGVNEVPVALESLEIGDWDAILLANRYNLIEQTPLERLFPECEKRGTSIIAAGPFAAGVLAGTNVWGPSTGVYQAPPPEIVAKVEALQAVCAAHKVPLGAAALQFALAHPVVCSVLTGPKSPAELKGIVDWWQTPIPPGFWRELADKRLLGEGTPLPA
jgi:D-threo-aldose 1-dehydrogenase